MNDTLALAPKTLGEAKSLADTLSNARTIPEALRKSPADVLAIVLAGAEIGLGPMQSIRSLTLIEGMPVLSAEGICAVVLRRPDVCKYLICVESSDTAATYETLRVGHEKPRQLTFTLKDADRAQLLHKKNWQKYPAAMLRARSSAALCRMVFADLILGVAAEEEEWHGVEIKSLVSAVVAPPPPPQSSAPKAKENETPLNEAIEAEFVAHSSSPAPEKPTPEAENEPGADAAEEKIDAWVSAFEGAATTEDLESLAREYAVLKISKQAAEYGPRSAAYKKRKNELKGSAK